VDALIEVFARAPDDTVEITTTHTDANGHALIVVKPNTTYLLDAVILRQPAPESKAVWESLWAAMTFATP
ncbi:MAG: cobalt/nickel transport protein, partial [Paracoccaceae bacterium]